MDMATENMKFANKMNFVSPEPFDLGGEVFRVFSERLAKEDMLIWGECLRISMRCNCTNIRFNAGDMLAAIGIDDSEEDRENLEAAFLRLMCTVIEADSGENKSRSAFLQSYLINKETGDYDVHLNPGLAAMCCGGMIEGEGDGQ